MGNYVVGLDGGSTYVKAALLSEWRVESVMVCNSGIDNNGAAERLIGKMCEKAKISREQVKYILATGYSRKTLDMADDDISEITAHAYGVRVTAPKEYRPLSLESKEPCDINSTCVVFAQSEVISLLARKYDRKDILAGMHQSMAKRIIKMMKASEKSGDILMTGGGALNVGIQRAFEDELMKDVYVAKYPQFNGAVGAALIARERL